MRYLPKLSAKTLLKFKCITDRKCPLSCSKQDNLNTCVYYVWRIRTQLFTSFFMLHVCKSVEESHIKTCGWDYTSARNINFSFLLMTNKNYISRPHKKNTRVIIQNIYNALGNKGSLKQNTVEHIMYFNRFRVQAPATTGNVFEGNWQLL